MKTVLNWLGDPCVHLIVIGLFVFQLFLGAGPDPNADQLTKPVTFSCYVCGDTHKVGQICPDRLEREKSLALRP